MTSSLLALLPLFLAPSGGGTPMVTFADDTFADGTWETSVNGLVGPGSVTVTGLQTQAGNPAPAHRATHAFVGGPSVTSVWAMHLMSASVYDPAVEPIGGLFFSLDVVAVQHSEWVYAGLEQGGKFYISIAAAALTGPVGVWETIGPTPLVANSFGERLSDGSFDPNSRPDFSAAGAPITFGFETGTGTGGTLTVIGEHDNFRVDINAVASTSVVRLGSPPNPNALLPGTTTGPVIGEVWDPIIDHASFLPAATMDFVIYSSAPGNVSTNFGTFLCAQIEDGAALPAGTPFSFSVPDDIALIGVPLCVQGASFDPVQGYLLTNALDVTIGTL